MVYHVRRLTITAISFGILVFLLWILPKVLNPTPPTKEEKRRDKEWVDTSPYWADRQACRWLGLCGVHHLRWDAPALPKDDGDNNKPDEGDDLRRLELRSLFSPSGSAPKWVERESLGDESWEIAGRAAPSDKVAQGAAAAASDARKRRDDAEPSTEPKEVPQFVLDYAPLVHLFSGENFWPSHIEEHIRHMVPYADGAEIVGAPSPLTLDNLVLLNNLSSMVFLTSDVDVETRPEWLHSHDGIPVPFDDDYDGSNGGINDGGNRDAKDGHTYDQPPHFGDGTTWPEVHKGNPLQRISDPRKLAALILDARLLGPYSSRSKRLRQKTLGGEEEGKLLDQLAQAQFSAQGHKPDESGYSKAPAVLVLVDKGAGILDAFWFFFYSYNLGQTVLKVRYGNHVGDWEHCMVRFENGVPRALFLSEHAGGQAYAWNALEKWKPKAKPGQNEGDIKERPVIYSAVGSHAMYAMPGQHPYVLPFKMLRDETDRGPLWDPARNHLAYHYRGGSSSEDDVDVDETTSLAAAATNPNASTAWFHFAGPWGDDVYPLGDRRQWRLFGQYHYINGPYGPKFKNLDRAKVCQTARCRILYSLDAGKKASWYS